jgi:hypothetical protein
MPSGAIGELVHLIGERLLTFRFPFTDRLSGFAYSG